MKLDRVVTTVLIIFALVMFSAVLGYIFIDDSTPAAQTVTQLTESTEQPTTATTQPTVKPKTPSTPAPAPTPPPPTCGQGGACTMAQVSAHNSINDCWVAYGGKVYNVTSYVTSHPGGADVFNSQTCGGDITNYLNGTLSSAGKEKRHSQNAYNLLASYYIADLK